MELPDTSSARVALVKQPGKTNAVPATPNWLVLPITQANLTDQLEATDSAVLRPDRQYSNARILSGSSGGDNTIEAFYGPSMDALIMAALQSDDSAWASGATKFNGSVKHYFSLEKFHLDANGDGVYKWFKDAQVNSLNFQFDANAFSEVTANFMSVEVDSGTEAVAGSQYATPNMADQFDTNSVEIVIKDSDGVVIDGVEVESGSLEISNGLRKRAAVSKFYGAGNASSRFSCMYNLSIYFSDMKFYQGFKNNQSFEIEISVVTPAGNKYIFASKNCKIMTYDDPIGAVDTDLMIDLSFRANVDDQSPSRTLTVTKQDAPDSN